MTAPLDLAALKQRQQRMWAAGDYSRVGNSLLIMGEQLLDAMQVRANWSVLDVACGSGNTTLAAARRYCHALGVDFVPAWLEFARARAVAEGFPAEFRVGDAEQLDFPDDSFDAVVSTVGAMFAPDQQRVADELLRVCKPGGTLGMANWTPDGFAGLLAPVVARHLSQPSGLPQPTRWGTEAGLRELFGERLTSLTIRERSMPQRFPSVATAVDIFRTTFGPILSAFNAVGESGAPALQRDLLDHFSAHNVSGDDSLLIESPYLEVVGVK